MATVCVAGTFDTKRQEYDYICDLITQRGVEVLRVDAGGFTEDGDQIDIQAHEVAERSGSDLADLRERRDRGALTASMAKGLASLVPELAEAGRIDSFLAIGGSGGSSIAAAAMQALPIGFPKLLVSTMAAGDVSPYVGEVDATLMYSVTDISGLNYISSQVLGNAAAAAAGMAEHYATTRKTPTEHTRPMVGMTMFGVTTPAADEARATLQELGYEVLVFHATGAGGRAMEKLATEGLLAGVLDLTTTELADDLVGGVLSAGPDRLEAVGRVGIPQVVSVGALDMVNFGPVDTVPSQFEGRTFFEHNPTVTLMRTTPQENAELGRRIATKLSAATGPTSLYLPLGGVSAISEPGGPFDDDTADQELFTALRAGLKDSDVEVVESQAAINEEGFGRDMATALHQLIAKTKENDGHDET